MRSDLFVYFENNKIGNAVRQYPPETSGSNLVVT